jgi:hypothetical protein
VRQRAAGHAGSAGRVETVADGVLRVLVADHAVAPVVEQVAVGVGHAQELGEREQRQIPGEVADEVERPPPGDGVDELRRPPPHPGLDPRDRLRRERAGEDPAQAGVAGGVHVEHLLLDVGEVVGRVVADLGRTRLRGERGGVPQHGLDAGVREHRPEPGAAGLVGPGDGTFATQPRERRVRHPLDVRAGVDDLERHQRHGCTLLTGTCYDLTS